MPIIVVEGVDASGKSTLLESVRVAIKRKYFLMLRHSCRPLNFEDVYHCLRTIEPFSRTGHGNVVIDRHPLISEPIYGPILRGEDLTECYQYSSASDRTQYLKDTVDRVIYCLPPREVILENLDKNPQLAGVKDRIDDLLNAYQSRMEALHVEGMDIRYYDWTTYQGNLEDLFFGDRGEAE